MNGRQIDDAFKLNPKLRYRGCFMNKYVPKIKEKNCFFVVNTLKNVGGIGHWVMFYILDYHMYFFDSLGKEPSYYTGDIYRVYNQHMFNKTIVFKNRIQNIYSSVCGAYVIYFAYEMFKHENICIIKSKFTLAYFKNDDIVVKYVNKLLGIDTTCNAKFCPMYMYLQNSCQKYCKCSI